MNQEKKTQVEKDNQQVVLWWNHAKSLSLILSVVTCCYMLINTEFASIQLDTSSLLFLVLAIFSIVLSILFYLKATESSRQFFNEAYKYTKNTDQLLSKIEVILNSLEDGYKKFNQHIYDNARGRQTPIDIVTLEQEKKKADKIQKDIINNVEKILKESTIQENKKKELHKDLSNQVKTLRKKDSAVSKNEYRTLYQSIPGDVVYFLEDLVKRTGLTNGSITVLSEQFLKAVNNDPNLNIKDMERYGIWDNGNLVLTDNGYRMLQLL